MSAYVFESKFYFILGHNWLKERNPKPNWFDDTWILKSSISGNDVTLCPIKNKNSLNTTFTTDNHTSDKNIDIYHNYLCKPNTIYLQLLI